MNIIDIIFIVPFAWFAYKGFTKGLIIELATLLALLTGIYIAGHFSNYTADFLRDNLDLKSKYLGIISFALTFILVIILVFLFGKSIEKLIKVMMLSTVNKIAGAIFGLLKVAIILSSIILIINQLNIENDLIKPKLQNESLLYHPVKKIAPTAFPMIKEGKNKLMDKLEKIKEEL